MTPDACETVLGYPHNHEAPFCDRLAAAITQAHAEGRAEGLEEAALFALRRADECEAQAKALPDSDMESFAESVASITWQAAADHLRSLATGVAGQPSGDAKEGEPDARLVAALRSAAVALNVCQGWLLGLGRHKEAADADRWRAEAYAAGDAKGK